MLIFPAIDLYEGCAVRLLKGDYDKKTIYSNDPISVARDFRDCKAEWVHIVDLEGARYGTTPNLDTIVKIKNKTGLKVETGGGIRNEDTVKKYLDAGIDRVILGTKAAADPDFIGNLTKMYGDKIAVGADIKDGYIAVKGWTEKSDMESDTFMRLMADIGVKTIICTDISKDGMMQGPNKDLYKNLTENFANIDFIASGGVSTIEDISALKEQGLYGAIIGKSYYEKAIDLKAAVSLAL